MKTSLCLFGALVGGCLIACEGGGEVTATCQSGCGSDSSRILAGTYRSVVAVKGLYQTFTFGSDSALTYVRENSCVEERDSGSARLQVTEGTRSLLVVFDRGWGADDSYRGRSCPPLVPLDKVDITFMEEPFPFRWVEGASAFEIQVSPISWMRFDKI